MNARILQSYYKRRRGYFSTRRWSGGNPILSVLVASPCVNSPTCGITSYCSEKVADTFLRRALVRAEGTEREDVLETVGDFLEFVLLFPACDVDLGVLGRADNTIPNND